MARKMKSSGVEWIGDIPEWWRMGQVKRAFDIALGKMLSSDAASLGDTLENYLCAANVKWRGICLSPNKQMWFSDDEKRQYLLNDGDVIVMEGGSAGTSAIYKGEFSPCYMQNSVLRCRPLSSEFDGRFLYYWLHAAYHKGYVDSVCNRATIQHYTKEKIGSTPLAMPQRSEQKAIVNFLAAQCDEIDTAIDAARQAIDDYKALKQALIVEAVFGGDEAVERYDVCDDWCLPIPQHWKYKQIRYLFELRDERNDKPLSDVNLISLYTDKGVVQHCDLEKTTGNKASAADGYKLVYKEDIVVNIILCWMGAVGRSAYNGVTSPAYDVYRPISTESVSSRYYHYLFRTGRFNGKCYQEGRGIMMMRWRTYSSEFRAIKVPVPPFNEQCAIADYLDEKCEAIDALIAERESLIADLESYKKSLIFEVVTGKREVA